MRNSEFGIIGRAPLSSPASLRGRAARLIIIGLSYNQMSASGKVELPLTPNATATAHCSLLTANCTLLTAHCSLLIEKNLSIGRLSNEILNKGFSVYRAGTVLFYGVDMRLGAVTFMLFKAVFGINFRVLFHHRITIDLG